MIEDAKSEAIRMDFGNYTIGRLIPGRGNYDDNSHPEYQRVLSLIVSRMLVLGYNPRRSKRLTDTGTLVPAVAVTSTRSTDMGRSIAGSLTSRCGVSDAHRVSLPSRATLVPQMRI